MSGPGCSDSSGEDEPPSEGSPRKAESDSDSGSNPETGLGPESDSETDPALTNPSSSTRTDGESTPETGTPVSSGDSAARDPDGERDPLSRTTRHSESSKAPDPEPASEAARSESVTIEDDGVLRWFFKTDDGTVVVVRDVLSSVSVVALIGLVLFGISGVWPPMVAVESPSMDPHMKTGDLIFVVDEGRFVGDDPSGDTGVVTYATGENNGYEKFDEPGDVIIFRPDGSEDKTPVIHRAHFWVDEGDNWVEEQANPDYLGWATSCDQVRACPADHAGFVTKGDANPSYDQVGTGSGAITDVVRPEWITGKSSFRIPHLGRVRLTFDELLVTGPSSGAGAGFASAATSALESSVVA